MTRWLCGFAVAIAAMVAPVASASAQEGSLISQARSAGLVGERYDGYLGIVAASSGALRSQVGAINIKRRALYTSLATRKGVTSQDVGIVAACTLLRRVAIGEAYLLGDNRWRRHAAGEAAPRPDYCG